MLLGTVILILIRGTTRKAPEGGVLRAHTGQSAGRVYEAGTPRNSPPPRLLGTLSLKKHCHLKKIHPGNQPWVRLTRRWAPSAPTASPRPSTCALTVALVGRGTLLNVVPGFSFTRGLGGTSREKCAFSRELHSKSPGASRGASWASWPVCLWCVGVAATSLGAASSRREPPPAAAGERGEERGRGQGPGGGCLWRGAAGSGAGQRAGPWGTRGLRLGRGLSRVGSSCGTRGSGGRLPSRSQFRGAGSAAGLWRSGHWVCAVGSGPVAAGHTRRSARETHFMENTHPVSRTSQKSSVSR